MSLRVLPTASAGIFASVPYSLTCLSNAQKVETSRPYDGDLSRQRVCVDDCRDGICGVVEAIDEFEAESDQQCHEEEQERQKRRDSGAAVVDVCIEAAPRRAGQLRAASERPWRCADRTPGRGSDEPQCFQFPPVHATQRRSCLPVPHVGGTRVWLSIFTVL